MNIWWIVSMSHPYKLLWGRVTSTCLNNFWNDVTYGNDGLLMKCILKINLLYALIITTQSQRKANIIVHSFFFSFAQYLTCNWYHFMSNNPNDIFPNQSNCNIHMWVLFFLAYLDYIQWNLCFYQPTIHQIIIL